MIYERLQVVNCPVVLEVMNECPPAPQIISPLRVGFKMHSSTSNDCTTRTVKIPKKCHQAMNLFSRIVVSRNLRPMTYLQGSHDRLGSCFSDAFLQASITTVLKEELHPLKQSQGEGVPGAWGSHCHSPLQGGLRSGTHINGQRRVPHAGTAQGERCPSPPSLARITLCLAAAGLAAENPRRAKFTSSEQEGDCPPQNRVSRLEEGFEPFIEKSAGRVHRRRTIASLDQGREEGEPSLPAGPPGSAQTQRAHARRAKPPAGGSHFKDT